MQSPVISLHAREIAAKCLEFIDAPGGGIEAIRPAANREGGFGGTQRHLGLVRGSASSGRLRVSPDTLLGARCRRKTPVKIAPLGREVT
jgi:hypothetical protein